jgi:lysophospholipase L1-like esterase
MAWAVVASRSRLLGKDHFDEPDLVACNGGTIEEFFRPQGNKNPAEWTPSMGRFDLVTLSFGGNDIGFVSIIESCYLHGAVCSNQTVRSRISALGRAFPGFLIHVANSVVVTGGNVVVMGYPELIEDPSLWPQINRDTRQCLGIDTNTAKSIRGWAGALNAAIANAVNQVNARPVAKRNGVHFTFIDVVTGQSSDGIGASNPNLFEPATGVRHELCSQGDDAWLNGITIDVTRSLHPNQAGEDAMGNLAAQVISGLSWPWSPPS